MAVLCRFVGCRSGFGQYFRKNRPPGARCQYRNNGSFRGDGFVFNRRYDYSAQFLSSGRSPVQPPALLYIILSGTAGALSWLFYFVALKYGRVSQVAPVDKLSIVLAAVLAVVFLGESLSPLGLSGILLITAGVVCVALDK